MRIVLALLIALSLVSPVLANPLDNLEWQQAVLYSFDQHDIHYGSLVTLVKKGKVSLDVGYSPKQEMIGAISIDLLQMKDYVSIPILDLIKFEPCVYVGVDRIEQDLSAEYDFGVGAKLLEVKF